MQSVICCFAPVLEFFPDFIGKVLDHPNLRAVDTSSSLSCEQFEYRIASFTAIIQKEGMSNTVLLMFI